MPDVLTFRLYAPLAAMGGVAVGEQRDGWDRPARSAVLGLIAACLGVDRHDDAAHRALHRNYGLALLLEHAGPTLIDYHTAQVPPARRGVRYATRAEELVDRRALGTILTRRAYRPDLVALGAVWLREPSAGPTLADIKAAMERPCFVPYLGRKSCPLGLPLAPRIGVAGDAVAALLTRRADRDEAAFHRSLLPSRRAAPVIALDADDAEGHPERIRVDQRRDALASRTRWQFILRDEAVLRLPEATQCS